MSRASKACAPLSATELIYSEIKNMSEHYDEQYEDIEFREMDRTKKVRKKRKNYMARFLILAGRSPQFFFLASGIFDVKNIEVTGNRYYSDKEVINLGLVKTGRKYFLGYRHRED